jgi:hypothetical protein
MALFWRSARDKVCHAINGQIAEDCPGAFGDYGAGADTARAFLKEGFC